MRYAIVYGEREWIRRALPLFLKRVINNESPVVFGKGDQIRDFVYVGDVVNLHNLCLENKKSNGQIFNVGSGKGTSIKELAELSCSLSENNLKIIYENTKEGQFSKIILEKKRNIAELNRMLLDINKAKNILGWEPMTELKNGMRNEYIWAKNNISRWDKIFSTKW